MDKELKIIPPEGYEVDREHSTFECIKFKPIKPQLPTTMSNWTIKEALQIMFPRSSKSLENSISYKFYKKVRGLSLEEYSKLLDSYHEKIHSFSCTDVDDSHCQCPDL